METFVSRLYGLPMKRFYKYVLRKFIGGFLKTNDLDLDQLEVSVALSRGVIQLKNLELEVGAINDLIR